MLNSTCLSAKKQKHSPMSALILVYSWESRISQYEVEQQIITNIDDNQSLSYR